MTTLTHVAIDNLDHSIEIGFEWSEDLHPSRTVLWSLFARDQRDETRQFVYKIIDDTAVQFVLDHNRGQQVNMPANARPLDHRLLLKFLRSSAVGINLEALLEIRGTLNVDGCDVSEFKVLVPEA